jgi:hypothetical protein
MQQFPLVSSILNSLAENEWASGQDFREAVDQFKGLQQCISGSHELNEVTKIDRGGNMPEVSTR